MKSKLIILGCGSSVGVPRIDGYWGACKSNQKKNLRTRCSAIIIKGSNSILIDTSPDLRHQLLSNKIKNISSVVFTHEHADQTNGLFELRPFFWKKNRKINVYGNLRTIKDIKRRHSYLFEKKRVSSYPPILKENLIKKNFSLGNLNEKISFKTFPLNHGATKSIIYVFEKVAYISDCNDFSILRMSELKKLNYLIIDCLKFTKHPSHFNLKQSLYIHSHLKPKKTILTNLHHDLDYDYLKKSLPKNVTPAFDGLKLNL